jgi:nucleoside-diphosphate-sugar epimerase
MNRTALVTGASGFVGARLVEQLAAQGWMVRGLGRSPEALAKIGSLGASPVRGDLRDAASLSSAVEGCTTVFHAGALFKLQGSAREFEDVNVQGAKNLLDAAQSSPSVTRFVQIGASAVVMGDPVPLLRVNEDLPLQVRSWAPYSSSKAKSEVLVLRANRPGFMLTSVIRPPLIWGKGMPMLDVMTQSIRAEQFRWPGDGSQPMSTCHVDNVCHAAMLAAESERGGAAYFVSDGEDGTLRQVITELLATRGIAAPQASAPFGVAWLMATIMEGIWRIFPLRGEPPITRQMLRMIGMPFTLDIGRARAELGYKPVITWGQGIDAMRRGRAES